MKRTSIIALTILLILTACTPAATGAPTSMPDEPVSSQPVDSIPEETPAVAPVDEVLPPAPANTNMERSNAYLDSAELLILESFPLQFTLALKGSLPTSCHQLKVDVSLPDTENKITVDVYSLTQPDLMCAQMLAPFDENIPLGSFPAGHYFLWVNGELLTEFDA